MTIRSRAKNNDHQQSLEACEVIQLDVIQKDNKDYVHESCHGVRICFALAVNLLQLLLIQGCCRACSCEKNIVRIFHISKNIVLLSSRVIFFLDKREDRQIAL